MSARLRISDVHFGRLRTALARAEEVVFAYATHTQDVLEVAALEVMTDADIESRSSQHVVLADGVRPRLIKTAWDRDQCLIEAHSHGPRGVAEFSASDLLGFEEWVPHVLWRLRGRPYVALVAASEAWDALAWVGGRGAVTVDAIDVTNDGNVIDTIRISHATAARLAAGGRR